VLKPPAHIERLRNYEPGKTVEQIAREYNLKKVAVLWNNENNLGTSRKAMEAVTRALASSNLYSDPLSTELREKIAKRLGKKPQNIIAGNGSEGLMMNIIRAFCADEDEILTSEGSFVIIYVWSAVSHVKCVRVPLTDDYRYDMKKIYQSISPKTKIIYLSNANNPTGAVITMQEMREFLEKVPKEILVIADEAYFEFSSAIDKNFPDTVKMGYPNIITLRTFSKAYGIAGIRIGYGIADEKIINPLIKVKLTFEPGNLAQAAGIGAMDDDEFLKQTMDNNISGLKYFYREFGKLGLKYIPSYGNFVMVDFGTAEKVQEIFYQLMKRGVLIRPLNAFGLSHCVRITVGLPWENQMCVEKLKEIL
jgi:histidinol-phosphate aminotransferase